MLELQYEAYGFHKVEKTILNTKLIFLACCS